MKNCDSRHISNEKIKLKKKNVNNRTSNKWEKRKRKKATAGKFLQHDKNREQKCFDKNYRYTEHTHKL